MQIIPYIVIHNYIPEHEQVLPKAKNHTRLPHKNVPRHQSFSENCYTPITRLHAKTKFCKILDL